MRDLLVTMVVLGSIPFIFMRPWIGVLVWSWISFMNPHRLSYGFAATFPFALIIGVTTFLALVFSKEKREMPWMGVTVVWLALLFWWQVTTVFALTPHDAQVEWARVMKIQGFTLVTLLLINTRERIHWLAIVIAMSIGFYGVKGGAFAAATGGHYRVWGPEGTFIGGNNEVALALVMVLPLMRYWQLVAEDKRLRLVLMGCMGLTALAILSSHSRGALLAGSAMGLFLWLKSPKKLRFTAVLLVFVPVLVMFMPEEWFARMQTIETYDQDMSAMTRINAWWFAFNLACARPFLGGGFDTFNQPLFDIYAPDPTILQDAHSIYFEVLGSHGFVGLGLYLLLGAMTFFTAGGTARIARQYAELRWAEYLSLMLQVSIIGYAVGGAFLGLATFDLYYSLIALVVLTRVQVRKHVAAVVAARRIGPRPITPPAAAHPPPSPVARKALLK